MASITFSGGTLENVWAKDLPTSPAGRLNSFAPDVEPVGPRHVATGTGRTYLFEYRTDYLAEFEVRDLDDADQELALGLIAALWRGELVTVATGDRANRTYANVGIAPGAEKPVLSPPDPQTMRRTLTLRLANFDGTPFVAIY